MPEKVWFSGVSTEYLIGTLVKNGSSLISAACLRRVRFEVTIHFCTSNRMAKSAINDKFDEW